MRYTRIEQALGLHQRLEVIYVVDGYTAKLVNEDETVTYEATEATIGEALVTLDMGLPHDTAEEPILMHVRASVLLEMGDWDKTCGILGINPWCINEGLMDPTDMLPLTRTQAELLGFVH